MGPVPSPGSLAGRLSIATDRDSVPSTCRRTVSQPSPFPRPQPRRARSLTRGRPLAGAVPAIAVDGSAASGVLRYWQGRPWRPSRPETSQSSYQRFRGAGRRRARRDGRLFPILALPSSDRRASQPAARVWNRSIAPRETAVVRGSSSRAAFGLAVALSGPPTPAMRRRPAAGRRRRSARGAQNFTPSPNTSMA